MAKRDWKSEMSKGEMRQVRSAIKNRLTKRATTRSEKARTSGKTLGQVKKTTGVGLRVKQRPAGKKQFTKTQLEYAKRVQGSKAGKAKASKTYKAAVGAERKKAYAGNKGATQQRRDSVARLKNKYKIGSGSTAADREAYKAARGKVIARHKRRTGKKKA